jgi:peptidoglycan/xylan/chitin deacetylase (PgdA/CDA1 family)
MDQSGWIALGQRRRVCSLPILAYHAVAHDDDPITVRPAAFREHLATLQSAGWEFIDLHTGITRLRRGTLTMRQLCLTFDDAYVDFRDEVVPLLVERGIPATVFVPFAYMGGTSSWSRREKGRRVLSVDEIQSLPTPPVTIGSHTMTHPNLKTLPPAQYEFELGVALSRARELTGREEIVLAYPFGEFTRRVRNAAACSGYAAAVTTLELCGNYPWTDPFSLERIVVRLHDTGHTLLERLERPGGVLTARSLRQFVGRLLLDFTSPARARRPRSGGARCLQPGHTSALRAPRLNE